jgi:hypothetical protein
MHSFISKNMFALRRAIKQKLTESPDFDFLDGLKSIRLLENYADDLPYELVKRYKLFSTSFWEIHNYVHDRGGDLETAAEHLFYTHRHGGWARTIMQDAMHSVRRNFFRDLTPTTPELSKLLYQFNEFWEKRDTKIIFAAGFRPYVEHTEPWVLNHYIHNAKKVPTKYIGDFKLLWNNVRIKIGHQPLKRFLNKIPKSHWLHIMGNPNTPVETMKYIRLTVGGKPDFGNLARYSTDQIDWILDNYTVDRVMPYGNPNIRSVEYLYSMGFLFTTGKPNNMELCITGKPCEFNQLYLDIFLKYRDPKSVIPQLALRILPQSLSTKIIEGKLLKPRQQRAYDKVLAISKKIIRGEDLNKSEMVRLNRSTIAPIELGYYINSPLFKLQ